MRTRHRLEAARAYERLVVVRTRPSVLAAAAVHTGVRLDLHVDAQVATFVTQANTTVDGAHDMSHPFKERLHWCFVFHLRFARRIGLPDANRFSVLSRARADGLRSCALCVASMDRRAPRDEGKPRPCERRSRVATARALARPSRIGGVLRSRTHARRPRASEDAGAKVAKPALSPAGLAIVRVTL